MIRRHSGPPSALIEWLNRFLSAGIFAYFNQASGASRDSQSCLKFSESFYPKLSGFVKPANCGNANKIGHEAALSNPPRKPKPSRFGGRFFVTEIYKIR